MYCIVMFIAERKVKEATRYFLVQRTNQRDVWIHVEAWNLLKVFWGKKVTQGQVLHRKYSVRNFWTFNTLCLPQLWKALKILYNVHNSKHWEGIGAQKQTSALSNIPKQIGYLFIHSNDFAVATWWELSSQGILLNWDSHSNCEEGNTLLGIYV